MSSDSHTIPPSGPHADLSEDDGTLRVAFPPPCRWLWRVVLLSYLAITGLGLFGIARGLPAMLADATAADEFVLTLAIWFVFTCMWLGCGALLLYQALPHAAGRELVAICTAHLTVRREMPLFSHTRTYQLANIRNLRASSARVHRLFPWACHPPYSIGILGFSGGVMAFDYGGRRTIRVGGGISEAEAEYLIARILERFPSLGPTKE